MKDLGETVCWLLDEGPQQLKHIRNRTGQVMYSRSHTFIVVISVNCTFQNG